MCVSWDRAATRSLTGVLDLVCTRPGSLLSCPLAHAPSPPYRQGLPDPHALPPPVSETSGSGPAFGSPSRPLSHGPAGSPPAPRPSALSAPWHSPSWRPSWRASPVSQPPLLSPRFPAPPWPPPCPTGAQDTEAGLLFPGVSPCAGPQCPTTKLGAGKGREKRATGFPGSTGEKRGVG